MPAPGDQAIEEWLGPLLAEFDRLALNAFQSVKAEAKADGSVVTELDRAVSQLTKETLRSRFPRAGFLSEEEATHYLPEAENQWVLDPIDGTAGFVRGFPVWGFGLGLMRRLEPCEGYLRFPLLAETCACVNGVISVNGGAFSPPETPAVADTHNVLIGSGLHGILALDRLKGIKLRNWGSNLYHLVSLALGRSEAMITQRCYIWDLVPGLPFTRARGFVEKYLDGRPFQLGDLFHGSRRFRLEVPIVIGPADQVDDILARLR
jgi:myo-inositol-1(or 4)-monophosphatase